MINDSCLICSHRSQNHKNWNNHKIIICDQCSFSYIDTSKPQEGDVFSPSEKSFIDRSIENDKERSNLFTDDTNCLSDKVTSLIFFGLNVTCCTYF